MSSRSSSSALWQAQLWPLSAGRKSQRQMLPSWSSSYGRPGQYGRSLYSLAVEGTSFCRVAVLTETTSSVYRAQNYDVTASPSILSSTERGIFKPGGCPNVSLTKVTFPIFDKRFWCCSTKRAWEDDIVVIVALYPSSRLSLSLDLYRRHMDQNAFEGRSSSRRGALPIVEFASRLTSSEGGSSSVGGSLSASTS